MRRKCNTPTPDYRTVSPQHAEKLARFRQQMADVARGELLKRLRETQHLSQESAAYELGVSVKSIRSWEKGGGIKWRNAKRAGEFYGVDPESIVSREGAVSPTDAIEEPAPDDAQRTQIRELIGGQALLLSELEKVQRSLQVLRESLPRDDRTGRGSGNG